MLQQLNTKLKEQEGWMRETTTQVKRMKIQKDKTSIQQSPVFSCLSGFAQVSLGGSK